MTKQCLNDENVNCSYHVHAVYANGRVSPSYTSIPMEGYDWLLDSQFERLNGNIAKKEGIVDLFIETVESRK